MTHASVPAFQSSFPFQRPGEDRRPVVTAAAEIAVAALAVARHARFTHETMANVPSIHSHQLTARLFSCFLARTAEYLNRSILSGCPLAAIH